MTRMRTPIRILLGIVALPFCLLALMNAAQVFFGEPLDISLGAISTALLGVALASTAISGRLPFIKGG